MARIFISYSRTDEAFARRLAASLSQLGADVWIDIEDIPAGMKWSRAIQEGLDLAELLMLIVSPDSMASQNVEDEWQYYLDQKKPVIPILWKPARIHFQLNRIQHIDFHRQDYDSALRDLHSELAHKGVRLNPLPDLRPTLEVSAPSHRHKAGPVLPLALIGGAVGILALVALVVAILVLAPGLTVTPSPTTDANASIPSPPATNLPAVSTATQISVPIGFPGNPVTHNQDWAQTTLRNFNGLDMKLVPTGCFTMGSTEAQIDAALALCESVLPGSCSRGQFEDEAPQTQVCFEQPFWIGHYEVTNAEYGSHGAFPGDNLPRTNVTWNEAQAFCQSRGGRLPTEAEWEYAARGPDGLIFPWGNEFDPHPLNYCDGTCSVDQGWKDNAHDDGFPDPAPVGSYDNASWVGAFDLSGNVWEWTSTIYRPYPYDAFDGRENLADSGSKRVLRGGSWNWIAADTRAAARDDYAGDFTSSDWYGFRCARDFQPSDLD
jgi:formylglycine-generating enzyme required for sulfatase activity